MRKDPRDSAVVEVSLKSRPEYLSRIRKIAACLADSTGMDRRESGDAALALTEACANAIRHGSPGGENDLLAVAFRVSSRSFVAEITDCGHGRTDGLAQDGMGMRLMRMLADDVRFLRGDAGLIVRITKRARRRRMLENSRRRIAV